MTRTCSLRKRDVRDVKTDTPVVEDPCEREVRGAPTEFTWVSTDEPHRTRRKEILAKHPEIRQLFGPEWRTAPVALFFVAVSLSLAWFVPSIAYLQNPTAMAAVDLLLSPIAFIADMLFAPGAFSAWVQPWRPTLFFLTLCYWLGGTVQHSIFLAIHEITHCLAFRRVMPNFYLAFVVNFPIVVPYCVAFRGYHAEHHQYQGVDGVDVDIPTVLEGKLLSNFLGKIFFCFFQIFFYALRPMMVRPQKITKLHLQCLATVLTFDVTFGVVRYLTLPAALSAVESTNPVFLAICRALGVFPSARVALTVGTFLFLLLGTFFAGCLHPMSGHFISEHFEFTPGQETYSYYGPLNLLGFNVGYHNEHHDFPNVPWTRLARVREIAPEYYNTLATHSSWPGVIFNFIFGPYGCYSRVKRDPACVATARKDLTDASKIESRTDTPAVGALSK